MPDNTQIPASRVEIVESGTTLMSRAWYRFLNTVYEFLGLATGVIPTTSGGTGIVSYTKGDLLYASEDNVLAKLPVAAYPAYLGTDSTAMPQWVRVGYGAFDDTTTQTAAANTPKAVTLNNTTLHESIDIGTPTSRIVATYAGTYNITFSLQMTNSSTSTPDDVAVWLRLNGSDVAYTASWITVPVKHSGVNGSAILTVNLFQQIGAGGYIELYWLTTNGTSSIQTIAGSTSPAYPQSPGVIVTLAQII